MTNLWKVEKFYRHFLNILKKYKLQIVKDTRMQNGEIYYFIEPKNNGGNLHQYIEKHKHLPEVMAIKNYSI